MCGRVTFVEQSSSIEYVDAEIVTWALASAGREACRRQHVLKHRHAVKWLRNLITPSDAHSTTFVRRQVCNLAPAQSNCAGRWANITADEIEKRTLASAVGAKDPKCLALADLERQSVDGPQGTKIPAHAVDAEKRSHLFVR